MGKFMPQKNVLPQPPPNLRVGESRFSNTQQERFKNLNIVSTQQQKKGRKP